MSSVAQRSESVLYNWWSTTSPTICISVCGISLKIYEVASVNLFFESPFTFCFHSQFTGDVCLCCAEERFRCLLTYILEYINLVNIYQVTVYSSYRSFDPRSHFCYLGMYSLRSPLKIDLARLLRCQRTTSCGITRCRRGQQDEKIYSAGIDPQHEIGWLVWLVRTETISLVNRLWNLQCR